MPSDKKSAVKKPLGYAPYYYTDPYTNTKRDLNATRHGSRQPSPPPRQPSPPPRQPPPPRKVFYNIMADLMNEKKMMGETMSDPDLCPFVRDALRVPRHIKRIQYMEFDGKQDRVQEG
jgi:hypothetical protein